MRTNSNVGQSSLLWADSLTNISIGGLLSEASLQGRFNAGDAKSNEANAGLQPSQLICDSFDAFLAGQMNQSQGPRPLTPTLPLPPPPQYSHSSILDAEDTCHAFAFQKFSSLEKESKSSSLGAGPKSFKLPHVTEVCSNLCIIFNLCCNIMHNICFFESFHHTFCRPIPNRRFHRAMLVQNLRQTCSFGYTMMKAALVCQASNG